MRRNQKEWIRENNRLVTDTPGTCVGCSHCIDIGKGFCACNKRGDLVQCSHANRPLAEPYSGDFDWGSLEGASLNGTLFKEDLHRFLSSLQMASRDMGADDVIYALRQYIDSK